jgi:hypothetical protein
MTFIGYRAVVPVFIILLGANLVRELLLWEIGELLVTV